MSRNRWSIFSLVVVVLLAVGVGIWTMASNDDPGTRVSIAWPGASAAFAMGRAGRIELGADLVQEKVTAEVGAVSSETEQTFVIRREKRNLSVLIIAGDRAIQPETLKYQLLDHAGETISSGRVRFEYEIAPHTKAKCVIADMAVQGAATIRIVRNP